MLGLTPARRIATAGLATLLAAGVLGQAAPAAAAPAPRADLGGAVVTGPVDVVVRAGTTAAAEAAKTLVTGVGGTITQDLGLIAGFAATVPAPAATALRALPGVTVTADAAVRMKSSNWLDNALPALLGSVISAAGGSNTDADDPDDGDAVSGTKLTGAGIGVALIDSGVAPVQGLTNPGKVVYGPDLSFESQAPALRYLDTYGHGTHMAGIIAGDDPASVTGTAHFSGVAPGAKIISVKVATADGASDVSQVIAGIDWVVEHRNDRGLNIRVLNLSFGTESTQSATLDPLSFAVEQAWKKGIVVVVSAGNDGFTANNLTMPAQNQDIIAVGAADSKGTTVRTDDTVADFSNRGNASRHADILATGRSIVSLRDPGSYIDRTYPTAKLTTTADPAQRFFRGSGTSQAAAFVSGSVALLLQQRPNLTPDQVKQLLINTATPIRNGDAYAAGAGQIDIAKAARTRITALGSLQLNPVVSGLGSLERSRAGSYVYDSVTGGALTGEKDIFGKTWSPLSWTLASKTETAWSGGTYNGTVWTGGTFGTAVNNNQTWTASTWSGRSWSGANWAGRSWADANWNGRSWSSQTWTGRSWSGRSWSAAGWSGEPWQ